MKLEIEIGQELIDYMSTLETPFMGMPIEEQIREYLHFCSGRKDWDRKIQVFKRPLKQFLLTEFGPMGLPEDLKITDQDLIKRFGMFMTEWTRINPNERYNGKQMQAAFLAGARLFY